MVQTEQLAQSSVDAAFIVLKEKLSKHSSLAIAVSGGVDSMTLASVARQVLGNNAVMVHAVSPAVPFEATERVQREARKSNWRLITVDAHEFDDANYRSNPVDRCYYCKSNLYSRVQEVWTGLVASGANLDDLGDYRPGLLAASEKQVVHPLVEAGIDKAMVRAIASMLGLESVASLPAQPCLSSRIETGISIDADDLAFVHRVESLLTEQLGAGDIRCRITSAGVRIEVEERLQQKNLQLWTGACMQVRDLVSSSNRDFAGFGDYERGSAFLTKNIAVQSTL